MALQSFCENACLFRCRLPATDRIRGNCALASGTGFALLANAPVASACRRCGGNPRPDGGRTPVFPESLVQSFMLRSTSKAHAG
ncbi:hypothetical protein Bxe_C0073 [Paraburkholderia xenovorans LB400]|uniref:Uncharacterized protein n=1 Tax=Paraburkholderia xenovorans (strain LB400) TaxID=266265 RepID=Q13IU0_PARXL|nr:hypothetical protein Bxe_C0073 [Paraburkholderia xenovorans LB400]